jgi:hypothetical protein
LHRRPGRRPSPRTRRGDRAATGPSLWNSDPGNHAQLSDPGGDHWPLPGARDLHDRYSHRLGPLVPACTTSTPVIANTPAYVATTEPKGLLTLAATPPSRGPRSKGTACLHQSYAAPSETTDIRQAAAERPAQYRVRTQAGSPSASAKEVQGAPNATEWKRLPSLKNPKLRKCGPRACGDVPHEQHRRPPYGAWTPRLRGCSVLHPQVQVGVVEDPAPAGMFRSTDGSPVARYNGSRSFPEEHRIVCYACR